MQSRAEEPLTDSLVWERVKGETGLEKGALRLPSVSSRGLMLKLSFRLYLNPVQSSSLPCLSSLSFHSHMCLVRSIMYCRLIDSHVLPVAPDSLSWHLLPALLPNSPHKVPPITKHNRSVELQLAIMAKTTLQPSSRKRKRNQDDTIAAPLRRSRRVAFRDSFRFNDLAPELRNAIYSMALRSEDSLLELTGKLSATARALSQVSRSVRTESLGIYFSENDFFAYFSKRWNVHGRARDTRYLGDIPQTEGWAGLFGRLAAPRLRSLQLQLGRPPSFHDRVITSVTFGDPLPQMTWAASTDRWDEISRVREVGVENLAIAVFQGEAVPTARSLRLFLIGTQVIMASCGFQ
jgi:hypothetical protein